MRLFILSIAFSALFFSCKKDEQPEPDDSSFSMEVSVQENNTNESYVVGLRTKRVFWLNDILTLPDGNFIVTGDYDISPLGYPVIASVNRTGTVNWINAQKSLIGTRFKKIIQNEAGILTIFAVKRSSGSSEEALFNGVILKFTESGDLLSQQFSPLLTGTNSEQIDAIQSGASTLVASVRTEAGNPDNSAFTVVDMNSGITLTNGVFNNFHAQSIKISNSGFAVIVGSTVANSLIQDEGNSLHVIDFSGTQLLSIQSSELGGGFIKSTEPLADNSLLCAIATNNENGSTKIVKLDFQGNVIFSIDNRDVKLCINQLNDRLFVYRIPITSVNETHISSFNLSTGELIWSRTLVDPPYFLSGNLHPSQDGGVVLSGAVNRVDMNTLLIKKLDSNGN